ncbi:hypothetical protein IKF34_01480 [Candidatus Saccharibacteria bacterium]|nr:hypothetical protein [Candidatus Saccharibacteria bacterium]
MTKVKTSREEKQKAQDYIEAYNLLAKGMEVLGVFVSYPAIRENPIVKGRLERAYILLKNDFFSICDRYPGFDDWKENIFRAIPRLGGSYTVDYIQEWVEGEYIMPEEDPRRYGGSHAYEDELAMISEQIYTVDPDKKDIDKMPKDCVYHKSYNEANEALMDAEAAKELSWNKIEEYTFDWDDKNGKITINGVYKVMKTKPGSGSDTQKIMEQLAKERAGKTSVEFEPKLKISSNKKRTLSHIISAELKMAGALKPIFFKGTEDKTLRFRSPVSRETVENERIEGVGELDLAIMRAKISAGEIEHSNNKKQQKAEK